MKKALLITLFVIILAAIAFIGFGGFGLMPMSGDRSSTVMTDTAAVTEAPAPSADPFAVGADETAESADATAEPTEAPAETEASEETAEAPQPGLVQSASRDVGAYKDIISSYRQARNEGWSAAQYTAAGLDPMPSKLGRSSKLGYALCDIDLDGADEMLIGRVGSSEIYAIYTLTANSPSMLVGAGENSRYYLEPDGIIVNVVKKDSSRGGYLFYWYENGTLTLNNGLIYDYNANPKYPWFYTKSADFNSANGSKTANTRAESAISAYKANYVKPEYLLVDEFA